MIQFDEHIFQMGWFNHQLAIHPPLVDFASQVKREDVKVKKEIKELPPQKIKSFR